MQPKTYQTDHVSSDDMSEILQLSREEYEFINRHDPNYPASGSGIVASSSAVPLNHRRQDLNDKIAQINAEIHKCDQEIEELQTRRALWSSQRDELLKEVQLRRSKSSNVASIKGKEKETQLGIDYRSEFFDWSQELKATMKKVFKIDNFRLCQQGVCNANMDARDIVCVMPTGGGKSLTYQLPALLTPGCTLVISPLISLITDQILHLKEAGVEAVMLTGGTPHEVVRDAMARLSAAAGRGSGYSTHESNKEIKLCYVTPEKVAKNRAFLSLLEKLASARKLARIVVDEAHCVSQLGHDFRPDYAKLSMLRQLFPGVPIMALTATCPPRVLSDLITILRLKAIVDGSCAKTEGTVYFSAPLYRKNLHYTVLPKPSASTKTFQTMVKYIVDNHSNETGIVYCTSKRDAENVAIGLNKQSGGKIKTGVYHADVGDKNKEELHTKWREGSIKVVCATIAFGLGIDKADVRFILHHSLSKSIDGFYQESGRAGRDGKDADCILYYRPQDASRLSSMICGEIEGNQKLHDMLRFAQDLQECRKLLFARYFSASSQLSVSSWTTEDADALEPCGHCDNCIRRPETVEHRDVTVEAWRALKVVEAVTRFNGRITLTKLADLARGKGGTECASGHRKSRGQEKFDVDVETLTGGKIELSKDDTETLLVHLLTTQYLAEAFHPTRYVMNVYILLGSAGPRLSRLSPEQLRGGDGPKINCSFRRTVSEKRKTIAEDRAELRRNSDAGRTRGRPPKRKDREVEQPIRVDEIEDEDEGLDGDNESGGYNSREGSLSDLENGVEMWELPMDSLAKRAHATAREGSESDQDDDVGDNWTYSMRAETSSRKRPRKSDDRPARIVVEGDIEFMVLSSD